MSILDPVVVDGTIQDKKVEENLSKWKEIINQLVTFIHIGSGTPEGAEVGSVGHIFLRTDGGAGTTLYVKQSGASTNTGWSAK